MQIHHPHIPFERYADDIICHCRTKTEAEVTHAVLLKRLKECNLKLNEEKTRIVYCKDSRRKFSHENISFDFLGYTFCPRYAMNTRSGEYFTSFLPAISRKSKNHIHSTIRSWQLNRKMGYKLNDIAMLMAPVVRGWINYYGKFYPREMKSTLQALNYAIVRWALRKYARLKRSFKCAFHWLIRVFGRNPNLFYHWQAGVIPCYFKIESGQVRRAE
jgi:RNA-directed DNA polymerase